MYVELHLRIVGALLLALAALNVMLPKRLKWKEELSHVSLLNRQIFLVHSLFIILLLAMMGVLSLLFTKTLLAPTPLAKVVLCGLTLFWTVRLFVQWLVYDWRLWRGQRFNTAMHLLFTLLWVYFVATFGWALIWHSQQGVSNA